MASQIWNDAETGKHEGVHHDSVRFRSYKKVSKGSNSFPAVINFGLSKDFDFMVLPTSSGDEEIKESKPERQESTTGATTAREELGPLTHLLHRWNKSPSPELIRKVAAVDQQSSQDFSPKVGRVAHISPELRNILVSGDLPTTKILPWYETVDDVFGEYSTEDEVQYESFQDLDCKNMPDYDPDQEYDVYEYSSEERLEPKDPFELKGLSTFASNTNREGHFEANVDAPERMEQDPTAKSTYEYRDTASSTGQNQAYGELESLTQMVEPAPGVEASSMISQSFEWTCSSCQENLATSPLFFTKPNHPPSLSPSLFIYSIHVPIHERRNPTAAFLNKLKRYEYLTSDSDYLGFTAFKSRKSDLRWLIVQEYRSLRLSGGPGGGLGLKEKEARHWWYRDGWVENGVAFYQREESSEESTRSIDEPHPY